MLLARVQRRVRRLLIRRGRWPGEDAGNDPFAAEAPLFASAVAASLQGRVALGPRAGQPVRRLRSAADAIAIGRRSACLEGFSLHADVAVPARRRDQLERVCRYILRPPLALERLTESTGGKLLYQFRRLWSDGSTALLLDPLELLGRLAALVPPAPTSVGLPWAPRPAVALEIGHRSEPSPPDSRVDVDTRAPRRWPWARLLQRVFGFDVLVCDRCGSRRRILGAVRPAASRIQPIPT